MDPLERALFQLTPTRTRCDLLAFSGAGAGAGEKIASGLLQPFLSHIGCAREQASKGGYSITLKPAGRPSWFTRATLERFVRFVSTPEILERVVSIEREILQIGSSIDSRESPAAAAVEYNGHDAAAQGGNSKLCLQRALESRKAMLEKEQGMAYARASVAGFDLAHIDDLVSFSDAFGATRLREACLNFKELCKKKAKDKHWINELAAMGSCPQPELLYSGTSGIFLTSEHVYNRTSMPAVPMANGEPDSNGSPNDALADSSSNTEQDNNLCTPKQELGQAANGGILHDNPQVPIAWPNHPHQYMYDLQTMSQKTSPYHGFAFPGMQLVSPYYPGNPRNMQWPPSHAEPGYTMSDSPDNHQRNNKHSHSKGRSQNEKARKSKQSSLHLQDGHSDESYSDSESQSDADIDPDASPDTESQKRGLNKRRPKKNSRKVVIRNINYISSKRRDGGNDGSSSESSHEDTFVDGELLKLEVENAVSSLQKHHKSTRRHHKQKSENSKTKSTDSRSDDSINHADNNITVEKGDESWQALQGILMRDDAPSTNDLQHVNNSTGQKNSHNQEEVGDDYCIIKSRDLTERPEHKFPLHAESGGGIKQNMATADPIVMDDRDVNLEGHLEKFECDEDYCKNVKRKHHLYDDSLKIHSAQQERNVQDAFPEYIEEPPSLKSGRGGDWFVVSRSDKPVEEHARGGDCSIFEGDQALAREGMQQNNKNENVKKVMIDDSFIVSARPNEHEQSASKWGSEMSIISSILMNGASAEFKDTAHSTEKNGISCECEPNDLQIVLERDGRHESFDVHFLPEIDYSSEVAYSDVNKQSCGNETTGFVIDNSQPNGEEGKRNKDTDTTCLIKGSKNKSSVGSLVKSKSEVLSGTRKPLIVSKAALQKSKMEKEEENRKRMEELLAERQKRIAQRSAKNGSASATFGGNNVERKSFVTVSSNDRRIPRSASQAVNKQQRMGASNLTKSQHVPMISSTRGTVAKGVEKHVPV